MQAGNEKDENWDGVWNICIPIFKYLLELYLSYKYSLFFFLHSPQLMVLKAKQSV